MRIFFDSSALCKYYINEAGTLQVQQFIAHISRKQDVFLSVSVITYAEIMATLRRVRHENRIQHGDFLRVVADFRQEWKKLYVVNVTSALIERSGTLGLNHTLKGCDAFQLASALVIGADLFVSSDNELNNAAVRTEIAVWNPVSDELPKECMMSESKDNSFSEEENHLLAKDMAQKNSGSEEDF